MKWLNRDGARYNRNREPVKHKTPPRLVPKPGQDDDETDQRQNESRDKERTSRTLDMVPRMIVSVDEQTHQALIFQVTLDELRCDVAPRNPGPDVGYFV